jgi:hypothetical protein
MIKTKQDADDFKWFSADWTKGILNRPFRKWNQHKEPIVRFNVGKLKWLLSKVCDDAQIGIYKKKDIYIIHSHRRVVAGIDSTDSWSALEGTE